MTFKTYEINVDLVHDTSTTCSNRFSQNDRNSAKLLVTITNKGAELDLSQAKSVRMSFKKPDGTRVFQNDCQPINAMKGKYQIVLKTQTLTSVGNVIAQIHIEEEDRIIDTQKFFFVVNDSLASDEAVESTNEFTIIQKAIEAGKKLEGVDINGIIAAGELAKGALPKSGGTMTGNIDLDTSVGSKSKGYRWRDATGAIFGLETSTTGELILYDYKAAARIWPSTSVA
uniref:BppU family phage baseplate upper protein n=1 Tax=Bacillus paranthracis TaxID=2026186 RepID=UPI001F096A4E